jgi:hypothetical protein
MAFGGHAAILRKALGSAPLRTDSSDPLLYAAALLVLIVAAIFAMGAPARRGGIRSGGSLALRIAGRCDRQTVEPRRSY